MMINKRLIGVVSESKKYIAGNVALQWCSLAANMILIGAICQLLEGLYLGWAGVNDLLLTAFITIVAVILRFICNVCSARMGFLSSNILCHHQLPGVGGHTGFLGGDLLGIANFIHHTPRPRRCRRWKRAGWGKEPACR